MGFVSKKGKKHTHTQIQTQTPTKPNKIYQQKKNPKKYKKERKRHLDKTHKIWKIGKDSDCSAVFTFHHIFQWWFFTSFLKFIYPTPSLLPETCKKWFISMHTQRYLYIFPQYLCCSYPLPLFLYVFGSILPRRCYCITSCFPNIHLYS